MPTNQISGPDLLKAVQQLGPAEFDAFLDEVLSQRKQPRPETLSAEESKLIKRINRGIPVEIGNRQKQLSRKRKKQALTDAEHAELVKLTDEVERRDADRAAALLKLAKLRRTPIRRLMKLMGIHAVLPRG
jgi:hypothetical protein